MKTASRFFALVTLAATAVVAGHGRADGSPAVAAAREAIVELDVARAADALARADAADPATKLTRALLDVSLGDYDAAVEGLRSPSLAGVDAAADLLSLATACARATAAAVVVDDAARGVRLRFQDEDDAPLAPYMTAVVEAARATLARDLGVELPRPLRVEVVRDLFTLAAMTGLAEESVQKTGTVAIAKWGRVTIVSPRAVPHGYGWADTLAHEMAHLAQTRGSRDRAPLWLQEGIAKREETRWRSPEPFDDLPPADAVAFDGLARGLGRPLDGIGPSIALLPTADHAAVTFAEVTSFVRHFDREVGDASLAKLLLALREREGPAHVDDALREVSGATLADWSARWRAWLATTPHEVPDDLAIGVTQPHEGRSRRDFTLGELLASRGRHEAAAIVLGRAHEGLPHDGTIRAELAASLVAVGRPGAADELFAKLDEVHTGGGRFYAALASRFERLGDSAAAASARLSGVREAPFDAFVACEGKAAPESPADPDAASLCKAARAWGAAR